MKPLKKTNRTVKSASGMKALGVGMMLLAGAALGSACQSRKLDDSISDPSASTGTQRSAAAVDAPLAVKPVQELKSKETNVNPVQTAEVKPASEVVPTPECLTVTFKHRSTAKHKLGEECVLHGNRIELPEVLRDKKYASFCVRVDGTAVHAKREKNQFVLAATRKATSVITVQGCPKDKACAQDCTPAKDAFMEGLVGDAGEGAGLGNGWKGEADAVAALDPAVKRELAALDEESMSDAWDSGAEAPVAAACGVAHAKGRVR